MTDQVLLTIGVAALAGILGQALARRLGIPGILVLLATGAFLGASGLGIVKPAKLGSGLGLFVELAVAVIIFEGSLTLRPSEIRRHFGTIGYLLSLGAIVTFVGASYVVHAALGFDFKHSILTGAILIVTGPTVVTPLLRFVRPKPVLAEMLRWEAILIDPIGALVGVVVLEAVLVGGGHEVLVTAATTYAKCLLVGITVGVGFGLLLERLLAIKGLLDDELKSPAALATAFATFSIAEWLVESSGLFAITAAGLTLAIRRPPGLDDIEHFKGRITSFMLGILFVLLAGLMDVKAIAHVGRNVAPLLGGLLVVRFVGVTLSTVGSGVGFKERFFLAWMSPRGVVAAATSSVVAQKLAQHGDTGADEIRTAIFCVICGTIVFQGLSARWLARVLGLLAPDPNEAVIVGAGPFGRGLAVELAKAGTLVTIIDKNPLKLSVLSHERLKTLAADAQSRAVVQAIDPSATAFVIANTPNDEANALICTAFTHAGVPRVTQLPSGASAAARGQEFAATNFEFTFGGRITLELVEREFLKGARLESLRQESAERVSDLEERLNRSFHPLVEVKPDGAPRLIREQEETLGPGTIVVGLASRPVAVPGHDAPIVAPPPKSKPLLVEVGLAAAASAVSVLPAAPLLRAPLDAIERARPVAATAYRPLAALLQGWQLARFGEGAAVTARAGSLAAYAVLAAAAYALGRRAGFGRWAAFLGAALFGTAAGHLAVVGSFADQGELVGAALLVAALALHVGGASSKIAAALSALAASALLGASLLFTTAGVLFVPLAVLLDASRDRKSIGASLARSAPSLAATGAYFFLRHRALGAEHLAALLPGSLAGLAPDARLYALARALLDAVARTGFRTAPRLGGPEATLAIITVTLAVAAFGSATKRSHELAAAAALLVLTLAPTWNPFTIDVNPAHLLVPSLGFALVAAVLVDAIGARSKVVRNGTVLALIAASCVTTALLALDRAGL